MITQQGRLGSIEVLQNLRTFLRTGKRDTKIIIGALNGPDQSIFGQQLKSRRPVAMEVEDVEMDEGTGDKSDKATEIQSPVVDETLLRAYYGSSGNEN